MPQNADGQMIDPHVSVPIANAASALETIAPDPLDDPHVQHPVFQGFFAGPVAEAEAKRYPIPPASSIIAAFPSRIAPASLSFSITVAVISNVWLTSGFAPH